MLKNGNLFFSDLNFVVTSKFTVNEFINSILYEQVVSESIKSYASKFVIKPQKINSKLFGIVITFNNKGKLFMVNLTLAEKSEIRSWENWSEDEELKLKEEHNNWLENQLGKPPYEYNWGVVDSTYDPRSGTSMITVRYFDN